VPSPENDPDSVWTIPFISPFISLSLRSGAEEVVTKLAFVRNKGVRRQPTQSFSSSLLRDAPRERPSLELHGEPCLSEPWSGRLQR
jgi:hypothetical protein